MKSQLVLAAAAALLPAIALAMNPEDVTGIISDTIVPNPELCESLCKQNDKCVYSLYHPKCDECWQMDCSAGMYSFTSAIGLTKFTTETFYYCDEELIPVLPTDCGNLTATATVTSLGGAKETSGSDSGNDSDGDGSGDDANADKGGDDGNAAGARAVGWLTLGAAAAGAVALVV